MKFWLLNRTAQNAALTDQDYRTKISTHPGISVFQRLAELHLALGRLLNLAGRQAGGADLDLLDGAVDVGADVLEIRLERTAGLAGNLGAGSALGLGGAAPGVLDPEGGFFAAHRAFVGHVENLLLFFTQIRAGKTQAPAM